MCPTASVKLGLYLPADLHARMLAANRGRPRGAVQDDYAAALADRLDVLDAGERSTFACVRGPKRRAPDLNSMGA